MTGLNLTPEQHEEIQEKQKQIADQQKLDQQHKQLNSGQELNSQLLMQGMQALISYLAGNNAKLDKLKPLEIIQVKDLPIVVEAINNLHKTTKNKTVDLSPLAAQFAEAIEELKLIPKTLPEAPEKVEEVSVKNFAKLEELAQKIDESIKALDLHVEAPVVNVPKQDAPVVNLPAPDLKPLQKFMTDILGAIKAIVITETVVDNSSLEKELEKANKTLEKLLKKPSGGGGGGGTAVYKLANGMLSAVQLEADGSIPVTIISGGGGGGGGVVTGNVASGATDSGNPVKTGGKYNATSPTFTDGQRGDTQIDSRGNAKITLMPFNSNTAMKNTTDNADATAATSTANWLGVLNRNTVFNGTTWDRMYGDATNGLWVNVKSGSIATTSANYATKIDKTTTPGVIYVGNAAIGSSPSAAVWQIKRLDTTSIALDKKWADGDDSFNNVSNDRATTVVYA